MENTLTPETRAMLQHVLATLAYRTQKALRGAPDDFADFSAGAGVRTPRELVRHMASVIGYARTFFVGGVFRAEPLADFNGEVERFHGIVADFAQILNAGEIKEITPAQLLQGPLSDAMTHAGQLALLRRLAGSPVASENFIFAEVSAERLHSAQALPAAPTPVWMGRVIGLAWSVAKLTARLRRK